MIEIKKNYPLKKFTVIGIGGPARFFVVIKTEAELIAAIEAAKRTRLKWVVVGEGSNLIAADKGYKGVVIQNQIQRFDLSSSFSPRQGRRVRLGAGNNLLKTIFKLDKLGLGGIEKMAGIPGTIGGAIYGCAGAYGQEIKDCLRRVKIFDGKNIRWISKTNCRFGYRTSIFKQKKNWAILGAEFELIKGGKGSQGNKGVSANLLKISKDIIRLREKKYPPGLRCPGSFFKNIKLGDMKPARRRIFVGKLPPEKIMYGKVPAGYLLETVGAKGMRQGSILVAHHHGNLIYNPKRGRARDVEKLSARLKSKVKRKFGIMLEEEVQYL